MSHGSADLQTCIAEIVTSEDIPPNQGDNLLVSSNTDSNSDVQKNLISKADISKARQEYQAMRKWERVGKGLQEMKPEENCVIRLFSFNILAQYLIGMYSDVYKHHDQRTLNWEMRKELLIQEILEAQATVICLQEMQQDHLAEFVKPFKDHGYEYLYKKRTNDYHDGLLFMYRSDTFNLVEFTNIEYFQSDIELLSRDNVAIIVKLSLKDSPQTEVVIATTHLLYDPERNDIRLGQTQILMAELERIAFIQDTMRGAARYLPIIIAGDFNLQPYSGVYEFITQGSFQYVGKSRTLGSPDHRCLTNSLIPPHLHVTDGCQHYHILVKRLCNRGEGQVMLKNSEKTTTDNVCMSPKRDQNKKTEVNVRSSNFQQIQIVDGHYVSFGSGQLTHPFQLRSVYSHIDCNGQNEVTTYQDKWITVDYIFFSEVDLVEKYTLPMQKQCEAFPTIPNLATGSDHLSLGATFIIRKTKRL